jgi:glycosyltransferase involved in cell wall biosynthesis
LVSILIPAYNAEKWIGDTIRSAIKQTWPRKEIIIINDGSSDNTLSVAKQFESRSVKVLAQENRGASAARNKALSAAQGDYIQWLDADDILSPDKISNQLKKNADDRDSCILYSSACGRFYSHYQMAKFTPDFCWQDLAPRDWLITKFTHNISMLPQAWLVNRRLTELAGPWDERLSLDDDGEYFCRVVSKSEEVKFIPEAKSYYRRGNFSSLSHDKTKKALQSLLLSINQCINYLRYLEDSERTRAACLKYLQHHVYYFYPDKHGMLKNFDRLAKELGGCITAYQESRKFRIVKSALGWEAALYLKRLSAQLEVLGRKKLETLRYLLSSRS